MKIALHLFLVPLMMISIFSIDAAKAQSPTPSTAPNATPPDRSVLNDIDEYHPFGSNPPPLRQPSESASDYLRRRLQDGRTADGEHSLLSENGISELSELLEETLPIKASIATYRIVSHPYDADGLYLQGFNSDGDLIYELRAFPEGGVILLVNGNVTYTSNGIQLGEGNRREYAFPGGWKLVWESTPGLGSMHHWIHNPPPPSNGHKSITRKRTASSIEKAVQDHIVKCELIGDGETTSHCQLVLTNLTSTSQKLTVPAFQYFIPQKTESQVMMSTSQAEIEVPSSGTVAMDLPTVCASSKIHKAPSSERVVYTPAPHPDEKLDEMCPQIVKLAESMENSGCYKKVPIAKERRPHMLSQLAIWKEVGQSTPSTADDVTKDVIRDETISAVSAGIHKTLTKDECKSLDTYAAKIFASVDLTLKQAKTKGIAEQPTATSGTNNSGSILQ
jgi:hypothetical protein